MIRTLRTNYIDLYMIQYPNYDRLPEPYASAWKTSWKVMEEYKARGVLKRLGVCNFTVPELDELWAIAKPKVMQLWRCYRTFLMQNIETVIAGFAE